MGSSALVRFASGTPAEGAIAAGEDIVSPAGKRHIWKFRVGPANPGSGGPNERCDREDQRRECPHAEGV